MDANEFAKSQMPRITQRVRLNAVEHELIEAVIAMAYHSGVIEGLGLARAAINKETP